MDYHELNNRTGLNFTTEEYETIERVYLGTNAFKDVAEVVRFFEKNSKEQGLEIIKDIDYLELLVEHESHERTVTALNEELGRMTDALHDKELQFIDSRREVKELKDELVKAKELKDELVKAKELGEMFAKEKEAKDAEIAKLNALLDAYRKVVDLSRFTQDEMVIALANGGVRL